MPQACSKPVQICFIYGDLLFHGEPVSHADIRDRAIPIHAETKETYKLDLGAKKYLHIQELFKANQCGGNSFHLDVSSKHQIDFTSGDV